MTRNLDSKSTLTFTMRGNNTTRFNTNDNSEPTTLNKKPKQRLTNYHIQVLVKCKEVVFVLIKFVPFP